MPPCLFFNLNKLFNSQMEENKKDITTESQRELPQKTDQEKNQKENNKKAVPGKNKRKDEIILLKDQIEEYKDKNLRLIAEFDNMKKRMAKERIELFKTIGEDIFVSLLPVLD